MAKKSRVKNPVVLILFAILLAILAYSAFLAISPPVIHQDSGPPAQACKDNMTQACSVGNCTGVSTCANGAWSPCRWQKVCIPGMTTGCIENGCAVAIKKCNECGTGYGPCSAP